MPKSYELRPLPTMEEIVSQWRRGNITAQEALGALQSQPHLFAEALMKALVVGQRLD